ncbi:MAG: hypothetical protein QM647_15235 [Asticcacaulis sp.]|uniref:CC0125/CC1285 family lipoprotein n=1 Tax=Asticcacaulis sp. TaxID=1872648 RepID=UPI0039E22196
MKKVTVIVAVAFAVTLTGCATKYQEMGFTGGVSAAQITSDTVQITARGNGYTDPDTIQRYALRKAAETTLSAGFDNFEILSDADRSRKEGFSTGSYGRGYAFASNYQIIKPGQTFMIKMRHGPIPDGASAMVFDAHEVVKFAATKDSRKCSEINGAVKCE